VSDDTTSFIDNLRSACLCDAGMPGYMAAVLVASDGPKTSYWSTKS
jgi:hypothetical protein